LVAAVVGRCLLTGLPAAEPLCEADVRRVEVEQPKLRAAGVAKAVADARRRCHEAARASADDLVAHLELGLPGEDVERIDEVVVHMRGDALEVGAEAQLDGLELVELGEDPVVPLGALHALASIGPESDDAVHGASMPRPATRS
jgi:hypothetical protein